MKTAQNGDEAACVCRRSQARSFIFQFEAYVTSKGYDIAEDDVVVARELSQCVKKNAATGYATYMRNPETMKTWSAMKFSLEKNFKEPNFLQKK